MPERVILRTLLKLNARPLKPFRMSVIRQPARYVNRQGEISSVAAPFHFADKCLYNAGVSSPFQPESSGRQNQLAAQTVWQCILLFRYLHWCLGFYYPAPELTSREVAMFHVRRAAATSRYARDARQLKSRLSLIPFSRAICATPGTG